LYFLEKRLEKLLSLKYCKKLDWEGSKKPKTKSSLRQ